jgi:alpha-tubulin suppressor-like RCC1 family protein
MRSRRALLLFFVSFVGASLACNAIVGVTDVRLKKTSDGGDASDAEPEQDAEPTDDSGTLPERKNQLEVALGEQFTCARKPDFTVKCWGDDTYVQTGTGGTADGGVVIEPQSVAGIDDAVQIASGRRHSCVVKKSGAVACWGYNLDGQLGDGTSNGRSAKPVNVVGLNDAYVVAAGGNFTCAVRTNGSVACWGGNGSGQLGIGSIAPKTTPAPVLNLTGVRAIAAGQQHACAVKTDGTVTCWGDGQNGQLGNGSPLPSQLPVPVGVVKDAVAVAAAGRSSYALTKDGRVYCWGANEVGQLGTGATNTNANATPAPAKVTGATAIWAGEDHACAVLANATVQCWGAGARGQLGDGRPRDDASAPEPAPVLVSGIQSATTVGTGGNHSCAPTTTGAILCWGANERGQLGNRAIGLPEYSPVSVFGYP